MKNKTHGGKRKGAGRPKKEKTKVMRVPESKVPEIEKIISKHKEGKPEDKVMCFTAGAYACRTQKELDEHFDFKA